MKKTALIAALMFVPAVAFAQDIEFGYFYSLLGNIRNFVDLIIPILIGIALIFFFVGLVSYVRHAEHGEGRKTMIAGLAALFIMVSVWGIVRLAQNILNVDNDDSDIEAPNVPR
jgi:uncharacterized membrane protein